MIKRPEITGNLATDLASLLDALSDNSNAKHAAAVAQGINTPDGRGTDGQSHAYGNAAIWLRQILDQAQA